MRGTEIELEEWGIWVRCGGVSLGANSVTVPGSTGRTADITDDRAMVIDRVVARLKQRDPRCARAVKIYYTQNLNHALLGEKLRTSKSGANYLLKSGVAWIDGVLSAQDEARIMG